MTGLLVLIAYLLSLVLLAGLELRRLRHRAEHTKALRRLQVRHRIATVLHWDGD